MRGSHFMTVRLYSRGACRRRPGNRRQEGQRANRPRTIGPAETPRWKRGATPSIRFAERRMAREALMTPYRRSMRIAVRLLLSILTTAAVAVADEPISHRPIPLIFDTDIGNDVDDALALGVIHALVSRG